MIAEESGRPPVVRMAEGTALGRYLERTREYGFARFVAEMSALTLLLRVPAFELARRLGVTEGATTALDLLGEYPVAVLAALALVGAPVLETLIFQWFPIATVRRLGGPAGLAALVSAAFFAALHFQSGVAAVLLHVPTGLVLAWCYLAYRDRGLRMALVAPAAVHFLLNLVALTAALWWLARAGS